MKNSIRISRRAAALAALIIVPTAASLAAAPAATPTTPATPTAASQWLSITQMINKLEAAGYRNIEKIEREHGRYEVKATNRDGQRVKLHVHPQSGAVLDLHQGRDKRQAKGWGTATGQPGVECNKRRCRDDLPAAAGAQP